MIGLSNRRRMATDPVPQQLVTDPLGHNSRERHVTPKRKLASLDLRVRDPHRILFDRIDRRLLRIQET